MPKPSPQQNSLLLVAALLLLLLSGWGAIGLCLFSNAQPVSEQIGALVLAGLMLIGTLLAPFALKKRRSGAVQTELAPVRVGVAGCDVKEVLRVTETLQALSLRMEAASNAVVAAAEAQANGAIDTATAVSEINEHIGVTSEHMESLTEFSTGISSSTHEMAQSIREVSQNMRQLLDAANAVNLAATKLATTIHAIDNSVELLNDTSQTTASSIMEMDATLREVDESVRATAAIADVALKDAEGGKLAVDEAVAGMQEIQQASAITAEVMENLSQRAGNIGSILSVIEEVAGRTNLLALNASIIAAKAGEHGTAFAVVADEIKKLAHKTKESTREITAVIKGVQNDTARAVKAIEQTERSIEDGVKRSRQSGESLDKIVAGIRQVAAQVGMIARAASEQTHGISDIRGSMEQMTNMLEKIGRAAREQTLASDSIAAAIINMRGVTAQVQSATQQQSTTSTQIADSAAHTLKLARETLSICHDQKEDSSKISKSVEEILSSTDLNLDTARSLDEMLTELQQHVVTLREMTKRQN